MGVIYAKMKSMSITVVLVAVDIASDGLSKFCDGFEHSHASEAHLIKIDTQRKCEPFVCVGHWMDFDS